MNPVAIAAMLLAASMAVMAGPGVRIAPAASISQPGENYQSNLPVVNGLRSCGGPGRAVQWRLEGCSGEGTCTLEGNGEQRRSEFEFIPSQDVDSLALRIDLVVDGETKHVYERVIPDSNVQAGKTYIVHGVGAATSELKGKTVTLKYLLYNVESGEDEVCGQADFQIV